MSLKSKYAILERFNVEALFNTYLGLPPREQIIALIVSGVVLLLILVLPISLAAGKLSGMEKDIMNGRSQIDDVVREIGEYNKEKAKLQQIESAMKSGGDSSVSTILENLANQSGMQGNVESVKPKAPVPSDLYDEESYDVRVSRVTLSQAIDFLFKIENEKGRLMRIKQIQMKPRYDNKKLMDISFVVSTFKLPG